MNIFVILVWFKKSLKIPKGYSEIKVIRRRIDNTITTRKG